MFPRFELYEDWVRLAKWASTDISPMFIERLKGHYAGPKLHPVLRYSPLTGDREFVSMREGSIPLHACDDRGADERTEAHAETMTCDSCFRSAVLRRRCLIPANILNEQRHLGTAIDQRCSFALESGELFAIAGVWDTWTNDQGHAIESFAIVTTLSTPILRSLFDRMPVVLTNPEDRDDWLKTSQGLDQAAVQLMRPLSIAQLREWKMMPGPVDTHLDLAASV